MAEQEENDKKIEATLLMINEQEKEARKVKKYWSKILVTKMGINCKKLDKDEEENKKLVLLVKAI